jgi:hypothetical protein
MQSMLCELRSKLRSQWSDTAETTIATVLSSSDMRIPGAMTGVVTAVVSSNAWQDTTVELDDGSGRMNCCIHSDVLAAHPYAATVGTGFVLRNLTVFRAAAGASLVMCNDNAVYMAVEATDYNTALLDEEHNH